MPYGDRIDPPNAHCEGCGYELTDAEIDYLEDNEEDETLCGDCYRRENEDPDQRLGGHDNPYEQED